MLGDVSHENLQNLKELYAKYICGLPFPVYTIPGNHEPYQSEDWVRITGNPRQFTVETKEFHVILLDRYSNPEYLHQIQPADISFIEQELRSANGKPILLCAHFFKKETDAKLEELLLDQPKIRLLLMGHTHDKESILTETFGGKSVVDTGNFSYALNVPENCTDFVLRHGWSITELKKEGTDVSVRKIYPDWYYPLHHLPQENYLHYYGSYSDCQSVHSYGDWIKVCESSF